MAGQVPIEGLGVPARSAWGGADLVGEGHGQPAVAQRRAGAGAGGEQIAAVEAAALLDEELDLAVGRQVDGLPPAAVTAAPTARSSTAVTMAERSSMLNRW